MRGIPTKCPDCGKPFESCMPGTRCMDCVIKAEAPDTIAPPAVKEIVGVQITEQELHTAVREIFQRVLDHLSGFMFIDTSRSSGHKTRSRGMNGVTDFIAGYKGKMGFAELKRPSRVSGEKLLSDEQKEFRAMVQLAGFEWILVRSVDDAVEFLTRLGVDWRKYV